VEDMAVRAEVEDSTRPNTAANITATANKPRRTKRGSLATTGVHECHKNVMVLEA